MPKLPYTRSTTNKSTGEEVNLQRGGPDNQGPRYACSHRERLVEESLTEFRACGMVNIRLGRLTFA